MTSGFWSAPNASVPMHSLISNARWRRGNRRVSHDQNPATAVVVAKRQVDRRSRGAATHAATARAA